MTIEHVATAQKIPQRYLEGILNQLRKGGLLEAQRGRSGGYRLAKDARNISMGDVVRLIDGPIRTVVTVEEARSSDDRSRETCAFLPTWRKVQEAIDQVLDSTTFSQLQTVEMDAMLKGSASYVI